MCSTKSNEQRKGVEMRKYIVKALMTMALFVFFSPLSAHAEEAEGLRVDDKGQVTFVPDGSFGEGVSTFGFSLYVKPSASAKVEFWFDESNGKIREFRYDEDTGKLSIYISGTEALMEEGVQSLTIGNIAVMDGNGSPAAAMVSMGAGSLKYVDGTGLKWMKDLEFSDEVEIHPTGSRPVTPTPVPTTAPTPVPTAQPTAAPTPVPTAAPPANSGSGPSGDHSPAATPTPVPVQPTPVPTKVPQAVQTPWPVRPSQSANPASPSPAPTETPGSSESVQESHSQESQIPETSETEGITSSGKGEETGQKLDWVFVMAIGAMLLFVIVAVMAMVVLKRKPRFDGFEDDF